MSLSEQIANNLQTIAENEQRVYDKGYEDGKAEGEEFIGVKYSDFSISNNGYYLPQTADARSLDKCMIDDNSKACMCDYLLANLSGNANLNRANNIKTVYMPSNQTHLRNTFVYCVNLTTIIGDFSNVINLNVAFDNCRSLAEIPYMPNLKQMSNYSFRNCTGLTSITFYKVLETWHTGALTGCTNIETINLVDGWNINSYVQHCPNLTQASLHDMIEKYADMTGQTSPILNVGSTNLEKIDDEHKAMATAKNVTLA